MKIVGVIPARFSSQRLPGKPLIDINGKPLIQRVYEQAQKVKKLDKLIVATDDEKIFNKVREFGGEVRLTPANCATGSDRVAKVAEKINCDLVVNIQGDELFFEPEIIEGMIDALIKDTELQVSTACVPIKNHEKINDKHLVKVTLDKDNFALYFSRSPIPYYREAGGEFLKHLGFYAFRKMFLLEFTTWPESTLEKAEKLEQLRILENGYRIKVVKSHFDGIGIDTLEDLEKAREFLRNRN